MGWETHTLLYVYTYWLFKLHGLKCNHYFYSCEMICGNESYRGRHNFEKHFAEEAKHCTSYVSVRDEMLRATEDKSFHGVAWLTKIEQVRMHRIFGGSCGRMWIRMFLIWCFQGGGVRVWGGEDSQGNVLSRATYEDLARQGLLKKYDWIHHLISWFTILQSASSTCSWY